YKALAEESVNGRLKETTTTGVLIVTNQSPDVPAFNHPVIMANQRSIGRGYTIVFDARALMREQADGTYKITSQDHYDVQLRRASLMKAAQENGYESFSMLGNLPMG